MKTFSCFVAMVTTGVGMAERRQQVCKGYLAGHFCVVIVLCKGKVYHMHP